MSIIRDNIEDLRVILKQADIGTSVLAPNGDGSGLTGVGKVLQVQQVDKSGTPGSTAGWFSTTASGTNYQDTGFSLTVTPLSSTSKLLVEVEMQVWHINGSDGVQIRCHRDNVNLTSGGANNCGGFTYNGGATENYRVIVFSHYIDSVNTTPTTFNILTASLTGGVITMGKHDGKSSIRVTEIAN